MSDIQDGICVDESGNRMLKDNASKAILTLAFVAELEGKTDVSNMHFSSVANHASESFIDNMDQEKFHAIARAVNELTDKADRERLERLNCKTLIM